jgi:8-amino-7-oxononanoate synthase
VSYLARAATMLDAIRAQDRYRELPQRQVEDAIDFASNDYLGLAREPQVVEALRRAVRVGSGGSRLLSGSHREDSLLEEELADWVGRERALLFSSGYLAAIGTIGVLAGLTPAIASDRANHACLIDGIRLAGTPRTIYPHGVPPQGGALGGTLVISESLFGMDGDAVAPERLLSSAGQDGVLLIDEAHALGVLGAQGGGLARGLNDPRVVVIGTLSKALGAHGGFAAGPAPVIELLVNAARTFVFDTALPPSIALSARIALLLARNADDRRARLLANAARLRRGLQQIGLPASGDGAIVPVVLGTEARAIAVSRALRGRKIFAPAIRPPTVPPGTSRLRLSVRADHTAEEIDRLLDGLQRCIATS